MNDRECLERRRPATAPAARFSPRALGALLFSCLTFPLAGCATTSFWNEMTGAMSDSSPSSYRSPKYDSTTSQTGSGSSIRQSYTPGTTDPNDAAGFFLALGLPFTLAFDLVTLPIQIAADYPPFDGK